MGLFVVIVVVLFIKSSSRSVFGVGVGRRFVLMLLCVYDVVFLIVFILMLIKLLLLCLIV